MGNRNLDRVTATGWYVSSTYLLTGEEKQPSAPVVSTHPFASEILWRLQI
jgi:hypothetical protein